jgi:hypothetical protein
MIQLIINKGQKRKPNSCFIIEELTDLVEAAVLLEFDRTESAWCFRRYGNDVPKK